MDTLNLFAKQLLDSIVARRRCWIFFSAPYFKPPRPFWSHYAGDFKDIGKQLGSVLYIPVLYGLKSIREKALRTSAPQTRLNLSRPTAWWRTRTPYSSQFAYVFFLEFESIQVRYETYTCPSWNSSSSSSSIHDKKPSCATFFSDRLTPSFCLVRLTSSIHELFQCLTETFFAVLQNSDQTICFAKENNV